MKAYFLSLALAGAAVFTALPANAQSKADKDSVMNVTGCLAQSTEANKYMIKDASGKTYELEAGRGVNLKAHVGHKVTITGMPTKESNKEQVKTGTQEELRVTNLQMVSTTCD
jgi:uncharacterized protein YdeI (BOF family)